MTNIYTFLCLLKYTRKQAFQALPDHLAQSHVYISYRNHWLSKYIKKIKKQTNILNA